jgi:hypothetical protein
MRNYNLTLEQAVGKELAKEVKKVRAIKPTWDEFWSMNEKEMKAYLTINNKEVNND